jgi:pyruvate/2-oxoglutarate/acetoin dehydrogenase E1 component/TPP-dependent pyruvate/acetoin dehydrogenase alpha subunit
MIHTKTKELKLKKIKLTRDQIIRDYRIAYQSRQASLLGRREVMAGKAKFGIFGDGKEVAQVAMAHAFQKGDIRSGYYRDQTIMFALGVHTIQEFFAQLYAHADVEAEPFSAGRQMNSHIATRMLDENGKWKNLTETYQSSADLSPTGSQMPRLVGLGYASKLYRHLKELQQFTKFSKNGNEVAFGTIGNASCAEGMFWESVNAIGVLQVPVVLSIWDDGYGISVPNEYQITKSNIGAVLSGFQRTPGKNDGFEIFTVRGWDYPALLETYQTATALSRKSHVPTILHVTEVTQPQGHSTSGSHERYKSRERLEWEREYDCLVKMREWMIAEGFVTEDEIEAMEAEDRELVESYRDRAWEAFQEPIRKEAAEVAAMIRDIAKNSAKGSELEELAAQMQSRLILLRRDIFATIRQVLLLTRNEPSETRSILVDWKNREYKRIEAEYASHLYSESDESPLLKEEVPAVYSPDAPNLMGFELLNRFFDIALARDPRIIAFGEDVGRLGDVNQGFKGLQAKYGELRVTDTGIRECTILGQAIGMALRGLRPIAEIQYLDYLLYALQLMSDDLATLHWRTKGGQKAPVIVRTRGHRLEGIWHAGSQLGGIINLVRGMHVVVPRNMQQAAGFYNTLLQSDDPALVIEVLNGYRLREKLPDNLGEVMLPLGVPEILREGSDVTVVTYGACCRIVQEAADLLAETGISAEVIDVRTLLPFDRFGVILQSLQKTNRIVFVDEDVPGGATAYMMREVLEGQNGYTWLDSQPLCITATAHRPAFGSDGDYWSKPSTETVFEGIYKLMHEAEPAKYPIFF